MLVIIIVVSIVRKLPSSEVPKGFEAQAVGAFWLVCMDSPFEKLLSFWNIYYDRWLFI